MFQTLQLITKFIKKNNESKLKTINNKNNLSNYCEIVFNESNEELYDNPEFFRQIQLNDAKTKKKRTIKLKNQRYMDFIYGYYNQHLNIKTKI